MKTDYINDIPTKYSQIQSDSKYQQKVTYNGKKYTFLGFSREKLGLKGMLLFGANNLLKTVGTFGFLLLSRNHRRNWVYWSQKARPVALYSANKPTIIKTHAMQGDAIAQTKLAFMYQNGMHGIEQSDTEAVKYYEKAVAQGFAHARYQLGFLYLQGKGVTQSDTEAVKLFQQAAAGGDEFSQSALSLLHLLGIGVTQSLEEADKYLMQASRNGLCQYSLMRTNLEHMGRDTLEVNMYFELLAEHGSVYCLNKLGERSELLASRQNRDVDAKTIEYFQKAADKDYPPALFNLGRLYSKGSSAIQPDNKQAFEYFQRAVDKGNVDAIAWLASMYLNGQGVEKSASKAFELYKLGALKFDGFCQCMVADMSEKGIGTKKSKKEAVKYYQMAVAIKYPSAKEALARLTKK